LSNNVYYKKFAFDVVRVIAFTRGSTPVHLTIMVREPQPQSPASFSSGKFNKFFDLEG
jgi:hypothetical protein